jgi:hypothetical protein
MRQDHNLSQNMRLWLKHFKFIYSMVRVMLKLMKGTKPNNRIKIMKK